MSLENDLARLKRLADPGSIQWVKVERSIERVIREIIVPFYPNRHYFSEPGWHKLPWGYELKHWCWQKGDRDVRYMLRKYDADHVVVLYFPGHKTEISVLIDLAIDISNGWLDEVKRSSRIKSSEK